MAESNGTCHGCSAVVDKQHHSVDDEMKQDAEHHGHHLKTWLRVLEANCDLFTRLYEQAYVSDFLDHALAAIADMEASDFARHEVDYRFSKFTSCMETLHATLAEDGRRVHNASERQDDLYVMLTCRQVRHELSLKVRQWCTDMDV